jgi:flagellar biosynthesis chaperone FliJ
MREVTNSISDIFITADPVLIISLIAAVAGGLGWLIARLHSQRKITQLETTLQIERQAAAERLTEVEKTFAVLSNEALRSNSQTFLQLAQETLERFQVHAKGELEQKERAVEHLVKPIRETLEKTEQQIRLMENERKQAYGALHKHLETLTQTQQTLHGETRNLVQALRRPEVRGQWGEMTLKRLVELAGMVDHCDFYEQQQATGAEGQSRPDMIVRMPDRWTPILARSNRPTMKHVISTCCNTRAMYVPVFANSRPRLTGHSSDAPQTLWCYLSPVNSFWGQRWMLTATSWSTPCASGSS